MITVTFAALAAICFLLAVVFPFTTFNSGRLNLIALGLFFLALQWAWTGWGSVK